MNTQFDQSSSILRKKILKNIIFFFLLFENFENSYFLPKKNVIILALSIEEITLGPDLSSSPRFRFQY